MILDMNCEVLRKTILEAAASPGCVVYPTAICAEFISRATDALPPGVACVGIVEGTQQFMVLKDACFQIF